MRSPCDETWPDVEELKFSHQLWTLISSARICKWCSVDWTSIHMPRNEADRYRYPYRPTLPSSVTCTACTPTNSPTWFRAELWTKCRQEWISDTVWLDAVFCANWSRSLMLLIYYRSFQHCYDWSQLWSWLSTALMTTMSLTQSPFVTALWLNVWWVTACLSVCLSHFT